MVGEYPIGSVLRLNHGEAFSRNTLYTYCWRTRSPGDCSPPPTARKALEEFAGMAHFETVDLPKTPEVRGPRPASDNPEARPRKRWWIWGLVIVVAAAGIWYFRTRGIQASNPGGVTATGPGSPGAAMSMPDQPLPVVVATTRKGDLPVYFNGLGTVTAFNTVTVRSRVDGQSSKSTLPKANSSRKAIP